MVESVKCIKCLIVIGTISLFVNNVSSKSILNSNDLIDYLKNNNIIDKVSMICTNNVCSNTFIGNKEILIKRFIDCYVNKIKEENLEDGINVELKGFPITKIIYEN